MPALIASSNVLLPEYPPPVITVTPFFMPMPFKPQISISSCSGDLNGIAFSAGSAELPFLGNIAPFATNAQ
jgi:hypothetical protein